MLQDNDGNLNFAINAWTSPNHKVFIAVTVHFKKDGSLIAILLDLKEVATSHSDLHLVMAFTQILDEFRISAKVSDNSHSTHQYCIDTKHNMQQCIPK